jgi:cupin 2 domain-containing protein
MNFGNLFSQIPSELPNEFLEVLTTGDGKFWIERIVSRQHVTPPGSWCDQNSTEWVLLLTGSAVLQFSEPSRTTEMIPGDWIEIPPRAKHRVESTSKTEDTVWLAIHWE